MMNPFVFLGSCLWSSVNSTVRSLRKKTTPAVHLGVRTISVGNLEVGGTGKTPLVSKLIREAVKKGLQVCVLTRGYQSDWEEDGHFVFPHSEPIHPDEGGDEAALIQYLFPEVYLCIGKKRSENFFKLKEELQKRNLKPIDLVILDDGLQHFSIERDLDLVTLTSRGFSQVLYRDFPYRVPKSALMVWTKGAKKPKILEHRQYVKMMPKFLETPPKQKSYTAICGIGNPGDFYKKVKDLGLEIQVFLEFPDHFAYSRSEVLDLLKQARLRSTEVLITGKDWMKWKRFLGEKPNDLHVLEPVYEVVENQNLWEEIVWNS